MTNAIKSEAQPITEEENIFRASTGLPFRCGMCGRKHKISSKSVTNCLLKLARRSGFPDSWFEFRDERPTHAVMQSQAPNRVQEIWPQSPLFGALHPSLVRELDALRQRISETFTLTHKEKVELIYALAHRDPVGYLKRRLELFRIEFRKKYEIIYAEQEHLIRPLSEKLRNWRFMPPESLHVEIIRDTSSHVMSDGKRWPDPIKEVTINGHALDYFFLLREFPTVNMLSALRTSHRFQSWWSVLYDFGLLDGVPAISWAMRLTSSECESPQAEILLVTLFTNRNFINKTREHELSKLTLYETDNVLEGLIRERKLLEIQ